MAKRLRMSNADYLAIAVGPALIMLLVGSLVFFLIEVFYQGEYQARLTYVFALFVFATVLVARIAIEMGSEVAAAYSVPLGLATFVVLQRFVEHAGAFSSLINLLLIAVVWWCAHRLTWDCTLIDDNQAASGEGLMQLAGADELEGSPPAGQVNQLLPGVERTSFWRRAFSFESSPHAPGLSVLYFSLAALPIFGVGQGFIPANDEGRRRYALVLLVAYVAAGLLLLVTTSFLGFRRYLRQRGLAMGGPIAVTWVGVGGVTTGIVLVIAMLLPRPDAEFAIAQPPWVARSPDGLTSSRHGRGQEGVESKDASSRSVIKDNETAPTGDATREGAEDRPPGAASDSGSPRSDSGGEPAEGESSDANQRTTRQSDTGEPSDNAPIGDNEAPTDDSSQEADQSGSEPKERGAESRASGRERSAERANPSEQDESAARSGQDAASARSDAFSTAIQSLPNAIGGMANLIKWFIYAGLAIGGVYLLWRRRSELSAAARDLWRDLRAWWDRLFGRAGGTPHDSDEATSDWRKPRKRFRDFQNPFIGDAHKRAPPEELVRYSFEAFEAWSADQGRPRSADQTPMEFVENVARAGAEMEGPMRELGQVYCRVAYGRESVAAGEVAVLRRVWDFMNR